LLTGLLGPVLALILTLTSALVSASIFQTAVVIKITVVLKICDWCLLLRAKVVHTDLQVCVLLRLQLIAVKVNPPPRTLWRIRRFHVESNSGCAFNLRCLLQIECCSWRVKTDQNVGIASHFALGRLHK
jgi:hypothetical protein